MKKLIHCNLICKDFLLLQSVKKVTLNSTQCLWNWLENLFHNDWHEIQRKKVKLNHLTRNKNKNHSWPITSVVFIWEAYRALPKCPYDKSAICLVFTTCIPNEAEQRYCSTSNWDTLGSSVGWSRGTIAITLHFIYMHLSTFIWTQLTPVVCRRAHVLFTLYVFVCI